MLAVLARFGDGTASYGVSELSRDLGMTKNMVYRALTTLVRHGYVVRDRSGSRYQLGFGAVQLAGDGLADFDLGGTAEPYLRKMRDLTGETASLAVPLGDAVVTVGSARGEGAVARRVPLGRIGPLHAGPSALAILAFSDADLVERVLAKPLRRYTAATVTDPERLREELDRVRRRGYALAFGDHVPNANGVSFPLLDCNGHAHAAISVTGSAERFTDERLEAALPQLQAIAAELNRLTRLYPAHGDDPTH